LLSLDRISREGRVWKRAKALAIYFVIAAENFVFREIILAQQPVTSAINSTKAAVNNHLKQTMPPGPTLAKISRKSFG